MVLMEIVIKIFIENFFLKGLIVGDKYLNLLLYGLGGGGDWIFVDICNYILEDVNSLVIVLKDFFFWC